MLRHHGADDEEVEIELTRLRAQHVEDRRRVLEAVIAVFHCWRPRGEIWEAEPAEADRKRAEYAEACCKRIFALVAQR